MRKKILSIIAFTILGLCIIVSSYFSYADYSMDVHPKDSTPIRLYGEFHGVETYYDAEFDLWKDLYDRGYRHLFVELPYYTGEFLNIWMQEDDNAVLDQAYEELRGSASHNEYYYQFLLDIKTNCPETVFHGIDVGHQNATTGARYLAYLEENGLKDSPEYAKAKQMYEDYISKTAKQVELEKDREFYSLKNLYVYFVYYEANLFAE